METIDILRGIGVSGKHLDMYKDMWRKIFHAYTVIMGATTLLVPLLGIVLLFELQNNDFLFIITSGIWLVVASFVTIYAQLILLKVKRRFAKFLEETWAIWPGGRILNEGRVRTLMNIGMIESFFLAFTVGFLIKSILFMLLSLIFLIPIPLLKFAAKETEKMGYTVKHLFKGNVDEITDKLTISLNGKKKLLIKSQSSRSYMIEFQNPYNLKLYVSRRADKKDFAEVSIMGVKLENLSEAKNLIVKIEKAFQ